MRKLWQKIADEPVMMGVIIVALINTFYSLSAEQTNALQLIIENAILLLSGKAMREAVTPVAKLKRGTP